METRHAIYFVPDASSAIYRFGASVLGTDAYTGDAVNFPSATGADWAEITREPRKYGFHATLKAPFRLAAGNADSDLTTAVDAFAHSRPVVAVGPLQVVAIGSFIALVPSKPCPPLGALAAACVEQFDPFRAPLNDKELVRRLAAPLSERQRSYVGRWGYPYVFEEFRFHMTLTGPLAEHMRAPTLAMLRAEFAKHSAAQQLTIDRVVVASQSGEGAFRITHSAVLGK